KDVVKCAWFRDYDSDFSFTKGTQWVLRENYSRREWEDLISGLPQLGTNPLYIAREAEKAGMTPVDYTVKSLKEGSIRFAAEQPE
ncbi:molybdopterin-dependent oxidoreductase, partial [Salmonella enterica subsp. enterica serovar Virginia]|nr:molybdopterin-dependent oxidoreductase [Salmonella enterica subsp. enterica serovar Virginia]